MTRKFFTQSLKNMFICLSIIGFSSVYSSPKSVKRLVSLNGSLTEIVFALGKGDLLVGVDLSSYYPDSANKLPKVGYQRTLSLEGILSLKPDLVVGTEEAGPANVLDRLKDLGISVELQKSAPSLEASTNRIRFLGKLLDEEKKAEGIASRIEKNIHRYQSKLPWKTQPVALMIYSRGKGMVNVAGSKTGGSVMIELAGATNYINEFEGYKPLTPEIVFKKKADVLLLTTMSIQSLGGEAELWKLPGFHEMKPEQRPKLIVMDDLLLLGFSARMDEAVLELQNKIAKSIK